MGFSQALTLERLRDFAEMADIEILHSHAETALASFHNEMRWNELYYTLASR